MTEQANKYRTRAVEARCRAEQASDPAARLTWQQVAAELDALADLEDRQTPHGVTRIWPIEK